ncbi:MAG: chitobiase/beta-hexosaminidase C-terminal domain-containing protein [Kiritimatiellae bacterium]|nr:chitobiase/beta-hexosaminidase C-terminal domain-containing protein [Kiritimatiellia bacterium]
MMKKILAVAVVLSSALSGRGGMVLSSASSASVPADTTFVDGSRVSSTMEVDFGPFDWDMGCVVKLNGTELLSAEQRGSYTWQPRKIGANTLVWSSANVAITSTVNVTALTFAVAPTPNPPMAKDSAISITPTTRNFSVGGGGNAIITSGSGTWTAAVSDPWITLSATSGNVGYPVAYTVSATTNIGQRVGYVYVSGHVHTVTQDGYAADVSPTEITVERDGGSGTITLDSPGRYSWDARPNNDWLSITPTHGVASGRLTYQVAPYYEVGTRTGSFTVGDKTVTFFQYGSRMKLSTYRETRDYFTHVIPITVNALAVTTWGVTPNASWISVVDGGNGRGGDQVTIAIAENPSWKARTGTVTIGTETFTVTQEGRTALEFSVSPTTASAPVSGGNGLFAVTATPDLPWTAASAANWLTILGNTVSGSGNGNVVFNASPNSTLKERTGKITVTPGDSALNAKSVTVVQPAATASISPTGYEFEASGEAVAVSVTVNDIVEWSIDESLDWISVVGSTSRVGPGTATISAAANNTIYPRSGTVTIAGKRFPVTQKGRGVEIEYDNIVFGTDGGMDSVSIHPDGYTAWTAVASDASWITIFQNDSGTGDAEVMYIISPYVGDGSPRTGWITIGDKKVYITQRAYDLDITPRAATVSGNAGAGEIGVSAGIGDVWQAIITEPWITIVTGYDAGTGSGTVRFTYTENNTGKTRTGKIIISGEAYTLTQNARIAVNVAASAVGGGSVSGAGSYTLGEQVTLTATPDAGYEFLYWTGDLGETMQNPLRLTAETAKSVTAHFGPLTPEFISAESSTDGVALKWRNLAWATQYKIYRAPTREFPTSELVVLAADGACTYLDTTGEVGTTYFYWVEAIGANDTTESKDAASGMKKPVIVYSNITYTNLKGAAHSNPLTYQEGATVVFSNPSGVAGYTFTGWTPAAISATMTGPQAIQANWRANTYTISYNANGGSGTMAGTAATYGQDAVVASNGFVRAQHVFLGWATSADGAVAYEAGTVVKSLTATQNGVVTLFAVWQETPPVTPPDNPAVPFAEALDEPKLSGFEADGDSDWTVVSRDDCKVGGTCIRGGLIEAYDEVGADTALMAVVKGAGTFSFWWRSSCDADPADEFTWDHASFLVDGVVVAQIDGITDWRQVSCEIPDGDEHTVAWIYSTDGYAPESAGVEDCVWIDGVSWSGDFAQPLVDPVITPASGTEFETASCTVTITCATPDVVIYYSTNGRTPSTTEANRYTGPFPITKTTTVKAVAVRGGEKSAYVTATITKSDVPTFVDAVVGKEVTGRDDPVTVPATWVTESLVSRFGPGKVASFRQKFGDDLAVALAKPSGKIGPNGEIRTVWDDYVAGTDPTDLKSVFSASITIVDGKIVISWMPNLNESATNRLYKVKSKADLSGAWTCPPVEKHRFFTVEVDLPDGMTETAAPGVFGKVQDPYGGVQLWENGPYWAECNVGASKPEEYGYYFCWGDTVGYSPKDGSWSDILCAYENVTWVRNSGIRMSSSPFLEDSTVVSKWPDDWMQWEYFAGGNLIAEYDAATVHLGAPWRMPTDVEMQALVDNCTTTWTTQNGVYGRLVTGKGAYASKSIFLPAAGRGNASYLDLPGGVGHYWSSSLDLTFKYGIRRACARILYFHSTGFMLFSDNYCDHYNGQSVRAVRESAK